jgi:hypothetical protein
VLAADALAQHEGVLCADRGDQRPAGDQARLATQVDLLELVRHTG